jgi:pimeloyl-ACP methyl ester carboxylesterase
VAGVDREGALTVKEGSYLRALFPLTAAILLGVLGMVPVHTFGSDQIAKYEPPGRLIDVGGRRLHLYCTGRGSPTVILEAGAGSFSIDWSLIQPDIAKTVRVCSYDRAGYGWSDPGPEWDTVDQAAHDLNTLLTKAGERPPYVLVGQSMGGLFARWYQHEYPEQVAGMVLVESYETTAPVNGKQVPIRTLSKEELQANLPPPSSLRKPPIPTGIHPPFTKLPTALQNEHVWLEQRFFETLDFSKGPQMMESWRSAYDILHRSSEKPDSLNGLPLVILAREDIISDEYKQQTELGHLSKNSHVEIAIGSGHFIQLERPDLVIYAIRWVMNESAIH